MTSMKRNRVVGNAQIIVIGMIVRILMYEMACILARRFGVNYKIRFLRKSRSARTPALPVMCGIFGIDTISSNC